MKKLIILLLAFLLFSCEKEDILVSDNEEVNVKFEIISTGDVKVDSVRYKTAAFFTATEHNPCSSPWVRKTSTSGECLAQPVIITAYSVGVEGSSLRIRIYFNDKIVADDTYESNGDVCCSILEYYHKKQE